MASNVPPRLTKKDAEILRQAERAAEAQMAAMIRPRTALPKKPKRKTSVLKIWRKRTGAKPNAREKKILLALRDGATRTNRADGLAKVRLARHPHVGTDSDEYLRDAVRHLHDVHGRKHGGKYGERRIAGELNIHRNRVRRLLRKSGPVRSTFYCKMCKSDRT